MRFMAAASNEFIATADDASAGALRDEFRLAAGFGR
jgi:hypothetical protein